MSGIGNTRGVVTGIWISLAVVFAGLAFIGVGGTQARILAAVAGEDVLLLLGLGGLYLSRIAD